MTLNTFIAAVCVVVAIMLTIAHIRFFFGEETHKQQGELFHQPPHDEAAPVSAGDTLRTRRRDNAATCAYCASRSLWARRSRSSW